MGIFLMLATYTAIAIFSGRFVYHVMSWVKASKEPAYMPVTKKSFTDVISDIFLDVILFRRLYRTNKLLWCASLTFHISFILVILRHARYFMYPVPGIIRSVQDAGLVAGYLLPASVLAIMALRAADGRNRYISAYNLFLLSLVLLTGITGLFLKLVYRTDLVNIKAYMLDILSFSSGPAPDSLLFVIHYALVLILIPSLPFHLIAAPLITMDARRREEGLELVMHEK